MPLLALSRMSGGVEFLFSTENWKGLGLLQWPVPFWLLPYHEGLAKRNAKPVDEARCEHQP